MKLIPYVIAACAFIVPIGFVVATNLGPAADPDAPVLGTMIYFYAPG